MNPRIAATSVVNSACVCESSVSFRLLFRRRWNASLDITKLIHRNIHSLFCCYCRPLSVSFGFNLISIFVRSQFIDAIICRFESTGRTMTPWLFFPPYFLWSLSRFLGLGGSIYCSAFVGWLCFRCFGAVGSPLALFTYLHRWRWSALWSHSVSGSIS